MIVKTDWETDGSFAALSTLAAATPATAAMMAALTYFLTLNQNRSQKPFKVFSIEQ